METATLMGSAKVRVFGPERRALTLGILLSIAALALEGMGAVPVLPTAVRELGGLSLFGWSFSTFMLAWLLGTVGGGILADASGPRQPMAAGLAVFGLGLLVAGLAHGMAQFLGGRALEGAGGGAMVAAAYVAIARAYPDTMRARIMALTASVWVVPALVGPAISGAVTEWLGWRFVFVGILPVLGLTALLVLPPLAPLALRGAARDAGRLCAALRVAGGTAMILMAPDLQRGGFLLRFGLVVAGAALLLPGLRALFPPGTLRARRGLPAGLVARGLLAFSFFGTEAFVPLGSGELRGATPTQAGLALTGGALGWVTATWLQDRMESRGGSGGRPDRVRYGFVVLVIGIVVVALVLLTQAPLLLIPLGWAIAGSGIGLGFSACGLICIAATPAERQGEVSGQLHVAEALSTAAGTGLGGALLSALVHAGGTPRQAHAGVFALTIAVGLGGALLARRLDALPAE